MVADERFFWIWTDWDDGEAEAQNARTRTCTGSPGAPAGPSSLPRERAEGHGYGCGYGCGPGRYWADPRALGLTDVWKAALVDLDARDAEGSGVGCQKWGRVPRPRPRVYEGELLKKEGMSPVLRGSVREGFRFQQHETQ
jgi:hypothetical protein